MSIVIPVYNEQENLVVLHERLAQAFDGVRDRSFEVVLVDDHSGDRTPDILCALAAKDPRVHWVRLSRNSGSHTACTAGLDHATGDAVVIMAADLQDPPELIPTLLARHAEGCQVVWAVREQREGESWFTKTASEIFYWLMNRLTNLNLPPMGADVLLADRRVVEAFRRMPERNLSLFAAISWLGFRQASVSYVKQSRHAGQSKWTIRRKIVLAIDSFVGFSYLPLRAMCYIGILAAAVGVLWAACILVLKLMGVTQQVGYASIMITLLILGGLQMLMLGILGEYLWRALEESRRRPRYFVESASVEETTSQSLPPRG
ncbi:MAG: glycosyltransferase family 2 protein [Verrucomicrobia bacterium]|nr:glycosyltransferase family 2 protein [Verrucomicrobiota bacterium]